MNASELKAAIVAAGHESHFFDRATMRTFGDTMRNYGVRDAGTITRACGETCGAWELYRRHPVKHGMQNSAYFDKATLRRVFPER